ncbi:hypothetical protein BGZ83_009224 [Gryganskiella cystojenkinii]|nr:hypothetical protein BGZ83_009224 [Gryganskiella cystojenkinii]
MIAAQKRVSHNLKDSDGEFVGGETVSEYESESDPELLMQHVTAARGATWAAAESPGPDSDIIRHSSDEYEDEDEMDEELGDEDDDEDVDDDGIDFEDGDEEDDELSDYATMEEMQDMHSRGAVVGGGYTRAHQHGPYLKSSRQQQSDQLRKRRPGPMRNRQQRLRTVSGSGLRLDTEAGASSFGPSQPETEFTASQTEFNQACDELTARLHQGEPSAYSDMKDLITAAVEWRKQESDQSEGPYSAEKLLTLERLYLGTWTKILTERRLNPHSVSLVEYLQEFVRLACLIVQKDGTLPELYAQVLAAMFEHGDLEIYKRNPKRPSRVVHVERMARFDDYSPEYGFEAEEIFHSHQDFQKLFVSLGGMEICMKAIEEPLETPGRLDLKLQNLYLLLCLLSRIRIAGDAAQVADFSRRLITAVLAYFPDHADSFKSVSKATVQDIISQVGYFLQENYPMQAMHSSLVHEQGTDYEEFDIHDPVSRFNLGEVKYADFRIEMAVRLMKTTRLDLRLAGLIELKEVLVRIQNLQQGRSRVRRRSDLDMDVQMELDRKPVEHLCNKLQSLQIVGYIFGPNIHLEIVQRSTDVLVFLVQAKVLKIDDVDLIWAAVGGNQHRSIVYGVYQVLSDVCNKLPQEFLRHLFQKLQVVPLEHWDLQLVELSRALFHAMVHRSKYNPHEGAISLIPYETLLNVLRRSTLAVDAKDESSFGPSPTLNREVCMGIARLLADGLNVGPLPQDRATLIAQCLQDLKDNHPGAIWSLQVVQGLFDSQFANNDTIRQQLYKQTCAKLPELYIANLTAYSASVKSLPPTASPTNPIFAIHSAQSVAQEYQKSMQLKVRLEFLMAMCRIFSGFCNTPGLADALWNCFIADPIGPMEQDEAFLCLESITDPRFDEYIYEKLLPGLDVSKFTPKAWQCARQYFVVINWSRNLLAVALEDGVQCTTIMAPLYGMDLIWKIALQAKSPVVGTSAIEFLSSLMKSTDEDQTQDSVYGFRDGLVQTCVDHLVESSDALASSTAEENGDMSLVFERCIGILKAFLSTCGSITIGSTSGPEIHGALDEEAMLMIKVNASPPFQVPVHPSSTLYSLRKAIANRLGYADPENVRLFSLGKDYNPMWDQRSLEELRIENGQTFLATKRQSFSSSVRDIVPARRLPTDLLLEPAFFERVRKIFLLDGKYASQAWEIVTRLPTSPVLLQSFEELQDGVDWNSLLDARSPFLLLYSFQILHFLIKRDQSSYDPEYQAWIQRFLELGGQEHLIGLLMAESGLGSTNSSETSRKALGLMLKVLVCLSNSADLASKMSTSDQGYTIPVFLNRLVAEILTSAARGGDHNSHDQSIVLNATNLISYFCTGPMGWQYFHAGADVRSLIYVSMVQSDSVQIRQTILDMGRKFCAERESPQDQISPALFFLDILQSFLPISKEYEGNCSELFEFFEIIAREDIGRCSQEYIKTIYDKLVVNITSHPSSETATSMKEDTVLTGMFKVATAMLGADHRLKQGMDFVFIDYVFDQCLFPVPTEETSLTPIWAKCQSDGSRLAAISFLQEASRGNSVVLRHVLGKTHRNFARGSDVDSQWGYDPQIVKRARCGFVGLQNLGATCYVNSIVQQFFMNKDFRYGILDAPSGGDSTVEKHDTLLYQLQVLFGHLQGSMKRSYNAHSFCYAYKDWDGNPMNVAIQMDVDEFFNILFDRLESSVKSTPQEELFKKQYGGKLVQQIKSKDCEHISEREDSFFSIQCEVKNKKSLEESLQLYVQGEILDGDNKYKCSTCDKHVDAIKRACIKELPQNLILHLKRFDYDMDTMRRIKINDRFEFPTRLNMEPYTLDYLTKKEQAQEGGSTSPSTQTAIVQDAPVFQYDLVGVLVHTGTADSGHYYSYIKDRSLDKKAQSNDGGTSWYHFNDSKVEEFDASEIPAKAFGGPEFVPSESPYMKSPPRSTTKPYSAYMLFYERSENPAAQDTSVAASGETPEDIKDIVAKENLTLLKDLGIFDRLFYNFVWELSNMYKTVPAPMDDGSDLEETHRLDYLSMEYGLDFFFSVLIHARDVDQELIEWTRFLSPMLAQYPDGCAKFLNRVTENQFRLCGMLLECPINQVREAVIALITEALCGLLGQHSELFGYGSSSPMMMMITSPNPQFSAPMDIVRIPSQDAPVLVQTVVQRLLDLLPHARANWRNFDEYFKLMYNITLLGRPQRHLMIQAGYVAQLAEFYISDERADSRVKKMGDKFTKPAFRNLMLTIQELVLSCDIVHSIDGPPRLTNGHGSGSNASHRHNNAPASPTSSSSGSSTPSSNSDDACGDETTQASSATPDLDQPIYLTKTDISTLLYQQQNSHGPVHERHERHLLLIVKLLQDRMDGSIVTKIVTHLSTHPGIGDYILETLASYMAYASDDVFSTILHVFKELMQVEDGRSEHRIEFILKQLLKIVETSPQSGIAYDCLDFFRSISDYGQCGRAAQAILLRESHLWIHELMLQQSDQETRVGARQFYMELLNSERAFNGWDDAQAEQVSLKHFEKLLVLLKPLNENFYQGHRRDDDEGWRFVDYFKALTELVHGDAERMAFRPYWVPFLDLVTKLDSQKLNLDYDKKEMVIFWNKIMNDDLEWNTRLAKHKPVCHLLCVFFVCLQHNQANVQFHRETLPIYFGLILRFSELSPEFHKEWAGCHNYTWALGAMKWGAFGQHCPEELNKLLQHTLTVLPMYRKECWRQLPSPETQRFGETFSQMARAMYEPENELAGNLFLKNRGLIHLTNIIKTADQTPTLTSEDNFYATEALSLLHDYLCHMTICRNTPYFAEAMDHWSNINAAIDVLLKNLMWSAPYKVFTESIGILQLIAREATYTQAREILNRLDKVHFDWRNTVESGGIEPSKVVGLFGGTHSPFCEYGVLEVPPTYAGVSLPPMRIGPGIFMHSALFDSLDMTASRAVLHKWFEPYWTLARLASKLDGEKKQYTHATELAALMAMEQLPVGVLTHFEILCENALLAAEDDDLRTALQTPWVSIFLEQFLVRKVFLASLSRPFLEAGTRLFALANVEPSMLSAALEENFSRIDTLFQKYGIAGTAATTIEGENAASETVVTTTTITTMVSLEDSKSLITSLQNLVLVGIEGHPRESAEFTQWQSLQGHVSSNLSRFTDKIADRLAIFLPAANVTTETTQGDDDDDEDDEEESPTVAMAATAISAPSENESSTDVFSSEEVKEKENEVAVDHHMTGVVQGKVEETAPTRERMDDDDQA